MNVVLPRTLNPISLIGRVALCGLFVTSTWVDAQIVSPAPAQCETVYAVHNDGNHSQVLAHDLNRGTLESLALPQAIDIQGLSRHPDSEGLYATTGNDAQLYTVDGETGELAWVGDIGFDDVVGLDFHQDGSLWGWSKQGLIKIDLGTGAGTLTLTSPKRYPIQGLTWNNSGTQLYAVANDAPAASTLWVYDGTDGQIACEGLPHNINSLDIRDDGLLVYAFDDGEQLGIHTYDVQNCQVVESTRIDTRYHTLSSLVWPTDACLLRDPIALRTYLDALEQVDALPEDFFGDRRTRSSTTRLINLSTRAPIQGGAGDIIAGFIIDGTGTQQVILRSWGLEAGVDPKLELRKYPSGALVDTNDSWEAGPRVSEIRALPAHLQVSQSTDAALLLDLPAGAYTVTLSSVGAKGLGLVGVDAIEHGPHS